MDAFSWFSFRGNRHQAVNNGLIHRTCNGPRGRSAMASGRTERMVNITATLPIPLLERIDELVHEGKLRSRSHLIREAVRNYLRTPD